MNEFYIYKYVHNNNIIYIGKTNISLINRVKSHAKESKFKQYDDVQIYCFKCENRIETDIYEKYLINKYKPILNIADKIQQDISIVIEEKEWIKYDDYLSFVKENNTQNNVKINKIRTRLIYPAFFTKTEDIILVEVPDFDILTEGKDMYEAINNTRDAISLKCISLEDDGEEIPAPSDFSILDIANGTFANEGKTIISFVDVDSTEYRKKIDTKTVRRNVALPSWLNYEADKAGVNVSRILQEALIGALKLERRI